MTEDNREKRSYEKIPQKVMLAIQEMFLCDSFEEEFICFHQNYFALSLVCDNPEYVVPKYIKDGLVWLNEQNVLV